MGSSPVAASKIRAPARGALQLVEKTGCTLRSNRVFGIFAEESVENQEMVLVVPPPCCQLFQVHGNKLLPRERCPLWKPLPTGRSRPYWKPRAKETAVPLESQLVLK